MPTDNTSPILPPQWLLHGGVIVLQTFRTCYPSNGVVLCMNYSPVVSATAALLWLHTPETARHQNRRARASIDQSDRFGSRDNPAVCV